MTKLIGYSFLVLALSAALPHAHAIDGGVSGGGAEVIIFDDHAVLADAYLAPTNQDKGIFYCPNGTRGQLNPLVVEELKLISKILTTYGASTDSFLESFNYHGPDIRYARKPLKLQSDFVNEQVLSAQVSYCFVDQLPAPEKRMPLDLPQGAHAEPLGYTEGFTTFLRRKLPKPFSIREWAKTIIHERLHAAIGGIAHEPIAQITDGLEVALQLYQDQQQAYKDGKPMPKVEATKIEKLKTMVQSMRNIGLATGNYRVETNGGGAVHTKALIDKAAYVSVGSMVGTGVSVFEGSEIINALVCPEPPGIRPHEKVRVYKFAKVAQSQILYCAYNKTVFLGKNSRITNSKILINSSAHLGGPYFTDEKDMKVGMWLGENAKIKNSSMTVARLVLAKQAKLTNVRFADRPGYDYNDPISFGIRLDVHENTHLLNANVEFLLETERSKWKNFRVNFGADYNIFQTPRVIVDKNLRIDLKGVICKRDFGDEDGNNAYNHAMIEVDGRLSITSAEQMQKLLYCYE